METIFIPVDSSPVVPGSSYFTLIPGCAIDGSASPVPRTKFELALKSFAASGRVQCNSEWGSISALKWGTYELCLPHNAQKLVESSAIRFLALKVSSGRVAEAWMADRPVSEITHLERVEKMRRTNSGGSTTFTKSARTAPQEENSTMDLESALRKALSEPLGYEDFGGGLRKDIAASPGAYAKPVEEFNPQPRARRDTPPAGTSMRAISLAQFRQAWPTIGQSLGSAMRAEPGSREIGDAGQTWASFDQVGLGIDSRFLQSSFSVPVTPGNAALAEAWAHSTGDKMAMAQVAFRKSYATRQPMLISKVGGQVTFSKSAGESADDGSSEAAQLLRRHSFETALAHMQILQDKIKDAMTAVGPDSMAQPHLSVAYGAASKATGHLANCLQAEDEDE